MDEKLKDAIRHDLKNIAKVLNLLQDTVNKLITDLDKVPDELDKSDNPYTDSSDTL